MLLAGLMIPVMNLALVMGVGVILPLALAQKWPPWGVAAAGVALSLLLEPGYSAILVLPWVSLAVWAVVDALGTRRWWRLVVAGFAVTASLALLASRLEVTLFGIQEPIVKLTALHFTYAGAGTMAMALRLFARRPGFFSSLTRVVVLVAPPVVALGFVFHSAVGQVGGASLMTLGVWLLAALRVPDAVAGPHRWLWRLSSVAPICAMVLGLAWAANQYWTSVPALTVPDMVPTHGALNAFGFVLCGLLGCHAERGSQS